MSFTPGTVTKNGWSGSSAKATTVTVANTGDSLLVLLTANSANTLAITALQLDGVDITPDALLPFTDHQIGTPHYGMGLFLVQGVSAGSHTVNAQTNSNTNNQIQIVELPPGDWVVDVASAVNTSTGSTNPTTASITPTGPNETVLSIIYEGSNQTVTTQTGFTLIAQSAYVEAQNLQYQNQTTATAVAGNATLGASTSWLMQLVAIKAAPAPTVTSVNGGASITEGAANVAVVGTNFASGMTSAIQQPGGVAVSQPTTYISGTSASFNLTMEPGTGDQLAFTDATYTTTYGVTASGTNSTLSSLVLVPPAGLIFQTLSSVNPNASNTITALPSLAAGDQLEASGNAAGTAAAPTGLSLVSDATFQFASGTTPSQFYVRAYDGVNKVWGAWALQSLGVAPVSGKRPEARINIGVEIK